MSKAIYNSSEHFDLVEFFNYAKNPTNILFNQSGILSNIKYTIISYFLCLMFVSFAGIIIIGLDSFLVDVSNYKSIYNQIKATNIEIKGRFGANALIMAVLVIPFIEETLFRLPLNFKKYSIALSVSMLVYRFSGNSLVAPRMFEQQFWIVLVVSISIFALIHLILNKKIVLYIKNNYFKLVYYFIIVSFGLVHISNIKTLEWKYILLYPLFVTPQIIMGFFLGNIRMKKGFIWSVALHGLINSTSFILG